jgi:mRNA-capping enzyme
VGNFIVPFYIPCYCINSFNFISHGETPNQEQTQLFISIVENFIRQNPTEIIGIHCTHGFNRTGFLTCAYLVEKLDFAIDIAVELFAQCRPPGIYKQDYLNELFKRYADVTDDKVPIAGPIPNWEIESNEVENGKCKYGNIYFFIFYTTN